MLAERLKLLRENKGLTQKQFAKKINTSPSSVAMWETKKREPDTDTIITFADFFCVSTDYLLGLTDDPSSAAKEKINESKKSTIINLDELSEESRNDLLKQLDMLKTRDQLKKYNEEASRELRPRAH